MKSSKKNLIAIAVVILIIAVLGILSIYVDKIPSPSTYATFWALVPSVVAITLALITKEVYSSLFIGIVIGSVCLRIQFYGQYIECTAGWTDRTAFRFI